jgi:uncharacterized protein
MATPSSSTNTCEGAQLWCGTSVQINGKRRLNRSAGLQVKTTVLMLEVKVKPRARTSSLVQLPDGTWVAQLKSPPVDGRANEELIGLVAERFRCNKSAVFIKAGAAGRTKLVRVEAS